MPYAALTDLEARFGAEELVKLADRDRDGTADPVVVEAALADAAAEIDAALARKYALNDLRDDADYPLLLSISCDLARIRLYDDVAPEHVVVRANAARRMLAQLGDPEGAVVLRGQPPKDEPAFTVPARPSGSTVDAPATARSLGGLPDF